MLLDAFCNSYRGQSRGGFFGLVMARADVFFVDDLDGHCNVGSVQGVDLNLVWAVIWKPLLENGAHHAEYGR